MKIKNNKIIAMFAVILMMGSTFLIMENSTTAEEIQDLRNARDFDEVLIFTEGTRSAADSIFPFPIDIIDFRDEIPNYLIDIQSMPIITTSESYLLYDNQPEGFGGYWADCEKSPLDGGDDDLCCWAATAANMLEWAGWGFVSFSGATMDNTDDFLNFFNTHTSPKGSLPEFALEWWFNGSLTCPNNDGWSEEEIDRYGFWNDYEYTDYVLWSYDPPNNMQKIAEWLNEGYAVGITIHNKKTGGGGHCITIWGYEYDIRYDPESPHEYYLGLYATDSDDNKNLEYPPDRLKYINIGYNSSGDFWEFGSYKISGVTALKPYPGVSRPIANAGGIYLKEGTRTINLDGSGSVNPLSDEPLLYRWDLTNDGSWDIPWTLNPTISHTYEGDWEGNVKLEVFDGRLRDVDFAYIREISIEPSLIDDIIIPNELYILPNIHLIEFNGIFSGLNVLYLYNYTWDFGDGTYSNNILAEHYYSLPGTYLATLNISIGDCIIGSNSILLTVLSAEDLTHNINEYIQSLDPDSTIFLKKPDKIKRALDGMLISDTDSVLNLFSEGYYNNVSEKLEMIRKKMDGEPNPKDWIIDSSIQNEICDRINDFLAYLETI